VPDRVGQRLLHHPEHRGRHRRRHVTTIAELGDGHVQAGRADLPGQPVHALQPGGRLRHRAVAQHVHQRPQVGHRPAADVLREPHRLARLRRLGVERVQGHVQVHAHDRERMRHHVVQVPGDVHALLGASPAGVQLALVLVLSQPGGHLGLPPPGVAVRLRGGQHRGQPQGLRADPGQRLIDGQVQVDEAVPVRAEQQRERADHDRGAHLPGQDHGDERRGRRPGPAGRDQLRRPQGGHGQHRQHQHRHREPAEEQGERGEPEPQRHGHDALGDTAGQGEAGRNADEGERRRGQHGRRRAEAGEHGNLLGRHAPKLWAATVPPRRPAAVTCGSSTRVSATSSGAGGADKVTR
jgi:hypothetical protein